MKTNFIAVPLMGRIRINKSLMALAKYTVAALYQLSFIFDCQIKSMSQIREIKCPHCGEWTMWNGNVDDRCLYCGEFLEPQRFSREVEKKINMVLLVENDYLFIKPTDGPIKRCSKRFLNSMRWLAYYVQIAFFLFVTMLLVLLSIFAT